MTDWTQINTFEALTEFQHEFRAMTEAEQATIIVEMLAHIEAYKMQMYMQDHNASTSREEPPLLRKKRRGRARKSRAQIYQEDHQIDLKLTD